MRYPQSQIQPGAVFKKTLGESQNQPGPVLYSAPSETDYSETEYSETKGSHSSLEEDAKMSVI